ncbi:MAG: hypothetical protein ABIT05_07565 [Chitinophagaceae bacterium]
MKSTVTSIFLLLLFTACGNGKKSQSGSNDDIPACVQKVISENSVSNPPTATQIDEYSYNGKRVFLLTAPCCDRYNILYDENCTRLCAPSGGLAGKGDGKCADFGATAKFVKLLWKNGN